MNLSFEKVILIVGAGAVENSWQPIIKVLEPEYNFEFDSDAANCFLALMVYQLRFLANQKDENSKQYLKQMLFDFTEIKSRVARELITFQKNKLISPRKEYFSILDKFIFQKHVKFALMSTNWDTVIDDATNYYGHSNEPISNGLIPTFHIHGSIVNPSGLYLPSEITKEPYRTESEDLNMIKNHATVAKAIADCNRVILYGLSLDPLDAELLQILGIGWDSDNLREIIVINPDHKKIAKRVKLVLNDFKRNINLIAYSPDDLTTKIQY
ncbi:hypothetical protein GALL_149150 [mine drainage metagenome]|uniref:SIR2-like domain-containing protein n=1 Tax=mine drainage metagenome TaxID=410659 RepID=A0A1J5S4M0_9ZZZZ